MRKRFPFLFGKKDKRTRQAHTVASLYMLASVCLPVRTRVLSQSGHKAYSALWESVQRIPLHGKALIIKQRSYSNDARLCPGGREERSTRRDTVPPKTFLKKDLNKN